MRTDGSCLPQGRLPHGAACHVGKSCRCPSRSGQGGSRAGNGSLGAEVAGARAQRKGCCWQGSMWCSMRGSSSLQPEETELPRGLRQRSCRRTEHPGQLSRRVLAGSVVHLQEPGEGLLSVIFTPQSQCNGFCFALREKWQRAATALIYRFLRHPSLYAVTVKTLRGE